MKKERKERERERRKGIERERMEGGLSFEKVREKIALNFLLPEDQEGFFFFFHEKTTMVGSELNN